MSGPLEQEREFVLASLRDLEREHDAGDLSDDDYRALHDRYTARAAQVLRALEAEAPAAPRPARRARRRRRWLLVTGLVCLAVAGLVLGLAAVVAPRLPGQAATGSPRLGAGQAVAEELAQAETLDGEGQTAKALALYQQVLQREPHQPEAAAEAGWIEFTSGVAARRPALVRDGQKDEETAVRAAPSAWAPRLYLATMEHTEGDDGDAVVEFRAFIADHPPTSALQAALPTVEAAFKAAGQPLPALPAGVSAPSGA